MPEIMTTKEMAKYLKLHEITITKYAAMGEIPAIRIGRVWRFDKEAIDQWIMEGQKASQGREKTGVKATMKTVKKASAKKKKTGRKR